MDVETCADEEPNWVDKVLFKEFPIFETEKDLLIEAGEGCARGGQGSNGAMCVLRFAGDKISFLATPLQKFEGWLYSVQPDTSHGLLDRISLLVHHCGSVPVHHTHQSLPGYSGRGADIVMQSWCEVERRALDGASRSLERELEEVIIVEVRIEETFRSD